MYPKLIVDLDKLYQNVRVVTNLCSEYDIKVCGVTKAFGGDERLARVFVEGGVSSLGDSRLSSIKCYKDFQITKVLIRCPQIWEAADTVNLADASVNTELATLEALDHACDSAGVERHGIMLMVDLGDLREGIIHDDEFKRAVQFVATSNHLYLYGVGANFNCLSFVLPDEGKMHDLMHFANLAKSLTGMTDIVISGGNSSNVNLMLSGGIPQEVNSLRLGESLLLGRERSKYRYLAGTSNDAFRLQASIVEVKEKPSAPWGEVGKDSYGRVHQFRDLGVRRRALLAFGHQDIDVEVLWPTDDGVIMVDSSSDYTVVDVTNARGSYEVGDVIEFRCGYHAIARAFSSFCIEKEYVFRNAARKSSANCGIGPGRL